MRILCRYGTGCTSQGFLTCTLAVAITHGSKREFVFHCELGVATSALSMSRPRIHPSSLLRKRLVRQPNWLLLLSVSTVVVASCNRVLGIDGIDEEATQDASIPDPDARLSRVARVGVFAGSMALVDLEVLFHTLDGEPFGQVNTAADGFAEIETEQALMATYISNFGSVNVLRTTFVGPNQQTLFGFFAEYPGSIDVVVAAGPAQTAYFDVRTGIGTATNLPAAGTTFTWPRVASTLVRRDGIAVDALVIARNNVGEAIGIARRTAVPRTEPVTTVTLPTTYESMVPYEVRGTDRFISIDQVVAERSVRMEQGTGVVAGRTFQLGASLGPDVEVEIGRTFTDQRWFRKRMAFDSAGYDVDPNWETALPNLSGVVVEVDPELKVRWDPFPEQMERTEIELGFSDSTEVDSWRLEAPSNLGEVTLPKISSLDFGATAELTELTISDFSSYANFAEYANAKDSQSFTYALLPERGELHGVRWIGTNREGQSGRTIPHGL